MLSVLFYFYFIDILQDIFSIYTEDIYIKWKVISNLEKKEDGNNS